MEEYFSNQRSADISAFYDHERLCVGCGLGDRLGDGQVAIVYAKVVYCTALTSQSDM